MDIGELLSDGISRPNDAFCQVLDDLPLEIVNTRPGGFANSIGWLAWHAARQQDAQVSALAGTEQVWLAEGWQERFGLDLPPDDMGYGDTPEEAGKVVIEDIALLRGYLEAATKMTQAYVRDLQPEQLDEIVDRNWNPPVTRGARLVSVIDDAAQHAGQAAYVRGLLTHGEK